MITNLRIYSCCVLFIFRICNHVLCVHLDAKSLRELSTKIKKSYFHLIRFKMFVVLFVHSFGYCLPTSHQHFLKVAWMIQGKENQTHVFNKRQKHYRYKLYSSRDWGRKDISAKKNNASYKRNFFLFVHFKHLKIKIQTIKPLKKHTRRKRREK